jgi:hypothetical protein
MADKKISALTAASTPLAGTEVLPIVQSGATVKVAVSDLTAGRAISATTVTATTGNFVVGTSDQGIDFSATPGTGTSELLADYEEGTWTPTVTALAGSLTSVVSQTGVYTKIGRVVQLQFSFAIAVAGTGAAALVISNLPFNASAAKFAAGSGREYVATGFQMQCFTDSTTQLLAQKYDGTYRGSSGDTFLFSITYIV